MFKKGPAPTSSYRDMLRVQRRRHYLRNSLVLIALGLFAGAGALAVVKPPEMPAVYQANLPLALPQPFPQPLGEVSNEPYISETQIRRGDTLAALLQRLRINESGLQQFLVQSKDARSIYKLYPGRSLQAALDGEGRMLALRYYHTPGTMEKGRYVARWLEVTPNGEGGFTAVEQTAHAEPQLRMAHGIINSSLFAATDAAGIPDAITLQMADILSSKMDFMKDLRKDDRFRVVYETYAHDGDDIGAGRILALEFINNGKVYNAVWFAPDSESGSYYDFEGKSLQGAFLRTALKFSRVSSTFGKRRHPIHGGWRSHNGVDWAAPTGTPIHATADGVVQFKGSQRGYGNTIILKHHDGYTTLYAHQSRFAKGLKKGDKVRQGDLIGYVGSTGWATGPHLHYEFRINNKPVDPLSVDLPVARKLDERQRAAFQQQLAQYQGHIEFLTALQEDGPTQLASR